MESTTTRVEIAENSDDDPRPVHRFVRRGRRTCVELLGWVMVERDYWNGSTSITVDRVNRRTKGSSTLLSPYSETVQRRLRTIMSCIATVDVDTLWMSGITSGWSPPPTLPRRFAERRPGEVVSAPQLLALRAIANDRYPLSTPALADVLHTRVASVSLVLTRLADMGLVARLGLGWILTDAGLSFDDAVVLDGVVRNSHVPGRTR